MPTKPNQSVIYRPLPPLLKALRSRAGMTQRELGDRINRTQWWIYRVEAGSRRLDAAEFILYCEGCDVDPRDGITELKDQIGGSIKIKAKTRPLPQDAESPVRRPAPSKPASKRSTRASRR